jgi:hypothetical protein
MSAIEIIVSLERVRRSRVALLSTRLQIAGTMMSMAESALDWGKAQRLEEIARRAYEGVARDFQRCRFSPHEVAPLSEQVVSLSKRLHIFRQAAPLRARLAERDARARLLSHRWRIEFQDSAKSEPASNLSPTTHHTEHRWRDLHAAIYSRRIH